MPAYQVRRVIAHVIWSDGTETELHTVTSQWTATHVCVNVPRRLDASGSRGGQRMWLPAAQVRADDTPMRPGEAIPHPPRGPHDLLQTFVTCGPGGGHPTTFPDWALAADNLDRTDTDERHYEWRCWSCGCRLWGPPHRENIPPETVPGRVWGASR